VVERARYWTWPSNHRALFDRSETGSVEQAGRGRPRLSLGRIKSESEPPNLPTEKNAACGVFEAANLPSPVRVRDGPTLNTPRNRGVFSNSSWVRARSLGNSRLNGGASRIRTLGTLWRILSESEPPKTFAQVTRFNHEALRFGLASDRSRCRSRQSL